MTWQPGQRVTTAQDEADWQEWRKTRKLQQQRARRASHRRFDYYASDAAAETICALLTPHAGGDISSTLDRIVTEWASKCHRNN